MTTFGYIFEGAIAIFVAWGFWKTWQEIRGGDEEEDLTTHNDPEFLAKSAELAGAIQEEPEPTPARIMVERMEEYHVLKHPVAIVTRFGERIEMDEAERRLEELNTELKTWIMQHGEDRRDGSRVLEAEGLPPLVVSTPGKKVVYVRQLFEHDPGTFYEILENNGLTADVKAIESAHKAGRIAAPLDQIIHKVGGSPRLAFDERGGKQ